MKFMMNSNHRSLWVDTGRGKSVYNKHEDNSTGPKSKLDSFDYMYHIN